MAYPPIIAIDVDLTVVDTVTPWKEWYTKLTGHDLGEITSENNDLETLMKQHNDPLKFWRKPDLYDDLKPIPEAELYIHELKKLDTEIVFVSACMPEHEESKRMFLRRNFKFQHGFVSTSDKQYVKCDYFIDDYKKYCEMMIGNSKVFQIKTSLNSPDIEGRFPYVDWEEIYEHIKLDLEQGE